MGCGQGDNPSSLNWKAFIDILNRAILKKTGIKIFYIRDTSGRLWRIKPIVFADDVRNQTVDGIDLQIEADVICAFCFIFGLRLNSNKTEMFIKNYGGEKDIRDQCEIKLRVMDEISKEVRVDNIILQSRGKDKHLGIIHDNERNGIQTLKDEIMLEMESNCSKLNSKKHYRASDKINCISTIIVPRATYKLRNSAISNVEMMDYEKIISKSYRTMSNTCPTFPTALLYMPQKWGGMGYKKLTDIVNNQKMAHLYRKAIQEGSTKNALMSMIDIACRERGRETKPYMVIEIDGSEKIKERLWINSVIEDAATNNVQLTIGGTYNDTENEWPENRANQINSAQHFEMDYLTKLGGDWK